jgi:hypothetical protein
MDSTTASDSINLVLVDELIIELDGQLLSTHSRNLLFRIYNAVHGTDNIEAYCQGNGKPTCFVHLGTEVC